MRLKKKANILNIPNSCIDLPNMRSLTLAKEKRSEGLSRRIIMLKRATRPPQQRMSTMKRGSKTEETRFRTLMAILWLNNLGNTEDLVQGNGKSQSRD